MDKTTYCHERPPVNGVHSGIQIASVEESLHRRPNGSPTTGPNCQKTIREETEDDEEEETSRFTTTSQSVVVTRYPSKPEVPNNFCNTLNTCEVGDVIQGRAKEKYELQRLNDRLSSFIERVRLLEAQNRTLAKEASVLRANYSGDITRLRNVYNTDLDELHEGLSAAEESRAALEVRAKRAESVLLEVQEELQEKQRSASRDQDRLKQATEQLKIAEDEMHESQQRCCALTEEREKEIVEFKRLQIKVKEISLENDKLSVAQHTAETDAKMLREELSHRKKVQDVELREISSLVQRESTQEAVAIFRTEILQVLREIQIQYEQRLEAAKADIHAAYEMKTQALKMTQMSDGKDRGHYKEENSRLRGLVMDQRRKIGTLEEANSNLEMTKRDMQIELLERRKNGTKENDALTTELSSCQAEINRLRVDFEALLDTKVGLELEIASYRRLLECEERRHCALIRLERPRGELCPPESPHRVCHTRSAKGNISIIECATDGSSITLTNTGTKKEDISGMKVTRFVDDKLTTTFLIPRDTILGTDCDGRSIRIWSRGSRPMDCDDLELLDGRWETGIIMRTVLLGLNEEEKAAHTLRRVPSQLERCTST